MKRKQESVDNAEKKRTKKHLKTTPLFEKTKTKKPKGISTKIKKLTPNKKINWPDFKKKKRTLREERKKQHNPHYETLKKAKKIWEELRAKNCPISKREELLERILSLLKGKIFEVMRTHDMSRVIQWILKLGSNEAKQIVLKEILPDIATYAQCRYAHHTVKWIVIHSNRNIRKEILNTFSTHLIKLLANKFGAPLVELIYSKYANSSDKTQLQKVLYNSLFKAGDGTAACLEDVISNNEEMKEAILTATKLKIEKFTEKSEALNSSLMHKIFLDYISVCSEKQKLEIFQDVRKHLKILMKSKDGTKIAMLLLQNSTPKEKKNIMKEFKTSFKDIAKSEHGYLFLLALIDSVDDTVLLKKLVIPALVTEPEEIATNEHGRKVLLYLIAHRDPAFFHPSELTLLSQVDQSEFVKKTCSQRMKELEDAVLEPLVEKIKNNPQFWLKDAKIGILTSAIVKASGAQKQICHVWESIAKYIVDEKNIIIDGTKTYKVVEHSGLHNIIKKLITHDKSTYTEGADCFSQTLFIQIDEEVLKNWILMNRGCFLLVLLIETEIPMVCGPLKIMLKNNSIYELLKNESSVGANVLKNYLEKVEGLDY